MTASLPETVRTAKRKARGSSVPAGPLAMFFRGFLKNPRMVGSIIPSSKVVIEKMLKPVDWANTKLFVEYGPGVGTFSRAILSKLGPDATYIAIDTNPDFVEYLRHTIVDPRFVIIEGSAADVQEIVAANGHASADYVLSGLPFSTLPPGVGDAIAVATQKVIRPGGAFLVYQFNPKVRNFFARYFDRVDYRFEPINIPPAQLWWAWKD